MSAEEKRTNGVLRLAMVCGLLGGGMAGADEVPELEFLEYLGSWEESDEDWLLFKAIDTEPTTVPDERIDPAPTGEESTETEDES
ncbi:MAG TPA: hypothetical protein VGA68_05515 [Woeseiaceae bacterium]|jgi:hypothetical protein